MTALHAISEGRSLPAESESEAMQWVDRCWRELQEAVRAGDSRDIEMCERMMERAIKSLKRRARKFERALRSVLGADLTDEQMAAALSATLGNHGRKRNPGGLSDNELEIVEGYRRMNAADRKFVRDLFDRVLRSSE
jgi:hypothetical protein